MIIPLFYLGTGALFHLALIGSKFDFYSAATWGVLLGWPLLVLVPLGLIGLAIAIYEEWSLR